jgi:large subunit ribosomal protein L19
MNIIDTLLKKRFKTAPIPDFRAGDSIQVHVKIVEGEKTRTQIFEGVVLRTKNGGLDSSFTVRKISNGIGVERTFPYYSPAIDRVEVVSRGSARRAKLYYLRNLEGKAARIDSELVMKVSQADLAAKSANAPSSQASDPKAVKS